jgi:hypothetical protein
MRSLLLCVALIPALFTAAQKIEQRLDYNLKPSQNDYARYKLVAEKGDSGWHRTLFYMPENKLAMTGWYSDAAGKNSLGPVKWYHPAGTVLSTGAYRNGEKDGTWVEYYEKGGPKDSIQYVSGKLRGLRLQWHENGKLADSTWLDAAGNGGEKSWFSEGFLSAQGSWSADTVKSGQWKYYYWNNGGLRLVEDYKEGKVVARSCYDSTGKPLTNCEETEADFPGGLLGWRKYLERSLNASVPVKNGAPPGYFTVVVQFIVDTDGSISDVKALTNHGYGMEAEVLKLIGRGPKWEPAVMFGSPVKAYRKQPVTFVVWEEPSKPKKRDRG